MIFRSQLTNRSCWLLSAILALHWLPSAHAAQPDRLLLATAIWPPYITQINGIMGGVFIQRLKCVLRNMKQPYRITAGSWKQAQLLVETNVQDGFFPASRTPHRDHFAKLSLPLARNRYYLYFSDMVVDTRVTPTNKLRWRASAVFGDAEWSDLHQLGFQVVGKPKNSDQLVDMLIKNKVDVVLADKNDIDRALLKRKLQGDRLRFALFATRDEGVYFRKGIVRKYPDLITSFNHFSPKCMSRFP